MRTVPSGRLAVHPSTPWWRRAADTVGAAETTPVTLAEFEIVEAGDPLPVGYDAVVRREHVHHADNGKGELRAAVPPHHNVRSIGSHDLVQDLAASALRATDPLITLASSNVGSLGGLVALRDGLCHLAGSHLLDPASGEYTLPYVDRLPGASGVAVVRLVHRDQGLIVAPGNPLDLTGLDDLPRPGLRYVNRQRGAGTRVLLDRNSVPAASGRRR